LNVAVAGMAFVCQSCLRHQFRVLKPIIAVRYYATAMVTRNSANDSETLGLNSYTLTNKVDHLLRIKNTEEAELILKKSTLHRTVYAWNLLIKYYAKLGNIQEADRIFNLVICAIYH
jgi:pentatricopeptide repeat protein